MNRLTRKPLRSLMLGASVFSLGFGGLAYAQDTADDEDEVKTLDRVVVTVERRETTLQDLAGTAAVVTGADLKAIGVQNIKDLDGKIPGVSIANNQGNIEVYIRGVGSSNNTELGDPAAATHLNGVYVPRPSGFGAAFFDIERVEVNIGPQGTLRGRNATAGSVNIIPWAPGIGATEFAFEAGYANFNEFTAEGVINLPVTENSAVRLAAFYRTHDSRLNNVSPDAADIGSPVPTSEDDGLGVAEAADDFGIRGAYKIEFADRFTFTLTGDYVQQMGSGFTGVNFALPLDQGIDPADIEDPRDVLGRGITPEENTRHWGVVGNLQYDGDWFNVEYIGSYRDLVYDYEFTTPASPFFDGIFDVIDPLTTLDNFSRIRFITDSESIIQELRIFSEDDATLKWTVGGFYFKENQRTFLGTTGDRNPFFTGVEFNQDTDTDSFSFFGDATWNVSDDFRVTGGIRYTRDQKERFGVNAQYQFIVGGAGFAPIGVGHGTEGFEFNAFNRTIFNPNLDGSVDEDGNPTVDVSETLQFFFDGVETFGARDGLDDIFASLMETPGAATTGAVCANFAITAPGCPVDGDGIDFDEPPIQPASFEGQVSFAVLGGNVIALQNGSLDNDFVDWRARFEWDLTEDNLLYGLIATGNKSGGFNDNIPGTEGLGLASPAGGAPTTFGGVDSLAPTYGPETLTLFEIGTKNEFDWRGVP
ncbi:MAG: TonB-dependent receptor [Pseudomonadota bacterium]